MEIRHYFSFFPIMGAVVITLVTASPAVGLGAGALMSLVFGNPVQDKTGRLSKLLLQVAVVLLGFGLKLDVVLKVGFSSIGLTFVSISLTILVGLLLGKVLGIERNLATLLSSGTAICGGSAIAAMAPAIGASATHTAVAMAIVFILNGLGLLIFPHLGLILGMSQTDFGIWSALAIHDTSSVVGAAAIYGVQALAVGTTVKLTRALWILPISFVGARLNRSESGAKVPWFLFLFLLAALGRSLLPQCEVLFDWCALGGKRLMVTTLFLVGAGLTVSDLKTIGFRPLVMAVILWVLVSVVSLYAILRGWVSIAL